MRDHPLMSYKGQRNWPPAWMWIGKGRNKYPHGEVGILKSVKICVADPDDPNSVTPYNRLYLTMDYLGARYMGCVLFEDAATCRQIGQILSRQRGRRMQSIGGLDLNHLL